MKRLLLLAACLLWIQPALRAAESSTEGFADYLYQEQEYERAITEYHRAIYENRENPGKQEPLRYKLALCHEATGDYPKAIALYESLISSASPELQKLSLFREGLLYFEQKHFPLAGQTFREFKSQYPSDPLVKEALYLAGASATLNRDPDAESLLSQKPLAGSAYAESVKRMRLSVAELGQIKTKSPRTAGMMSAVLPGAGQCYAGRCKDGLAALGFNGTLGGLTAAAFLNEEHVLGGVLAFIESMFYFGNIYGARTAAYKHNQNAQGSILESTLRHVRLDVAEGEHTLRINGIVSFDF